MADLGSQHNASVCTEIVRRPCLEQVIASLGAVATVVCYSFSKLMRRYLLFGIGYTLSDAIPCITPTEGRIGLDLRLRGSTLHVPHVLR